MFQVYFNNDSDSDNHAAIQISNEEFIDDDIEFVGTVGGATNSSIGDAVFRALDALIIPSVLPVSFASTESLGRRVKRYKNNRPKNWRLIAQYYKENKKVTGTVKHFNLADDKVSRTKGYWITILGRWVKDYDKDNNPSYRRVAVYGQKIDLELKNVVLRYNNAHAVPMTNMILRLQLITLLQADNREDILDRIAEPTEAITEIKDLRFDDSWAQRFYKRHKLVSRVATTKMKDEIPEKYEEKVLTCKLLLSLNIVNHSVPDAFIVNFDETNTLFVPQISKTRCMKGTRRVRLIGIGHDKAQVTCTPCVNAEGDVVKPTQIIFGGKTKRCEPNTGKPPFPKDIYYDHSTSHWQTPETMIRYLDTVLKPYRLATIERLHLSDDQKMIVILDLHYSHKEPAVLALMIPIYVPALGAQICTRFATE